MAELSWTTKELQAQRSANSCMDWWQWTSTSQRQASELRSSSLSPVRNSLILSRQLKRKCSASPSPAKSPLRHACHHDPAVHGASSSGHTPQDSLVSNVSVLASAMFSRLAVDHDGDSEHQQARTSYPPLRALPKKWWSAGLPWKGACVH